MGISLLCLSPTFAKKIHKSVSLVSAFSLLMIIILSFIEYFEVFLQIGMGIIALIITHNTLAFMLGYVSGLTCNAPKASARSLTFEIGIQNSGLGIVILLTQLEGIGGAGIVAGLWGINELKEFIQIRRENDLNSSVFCFVFRVYRVKL